MSKLLRIRVDTSRFHGYDDTKIRVVTLWRHYRNGGLSRVFSFHRKTRPKGDELRAINKINNNVALCVDGNGKEVVAIGKGIGFPAMPYDVDLQNVTMTFYRIEQPFLALIQELPEPILLISAAIVQEAKRLIPAALNPNLVVSLADHINFAIIRMRKFREIKLPFSYDVEQFYPAETELGRRALKLIQKQLQVTLPPSEVTAIAVHIINAEDAYVPADGHTDVETLIESVAERIETQMNARIDRNSLNYNRFVTHLRYYIARVSDGVQAPDENSPLLQPIKDDFPDLYQCAAEIGSLISTAYNSETTDNEILYLALHINRMLRNSMLENH